MKLTVLVDNNASVGNDLPAESGLSYYIEDGETRLLWDCGFTDMFLTNAAALGVDVSRIDTLALSHGHDDHCTGLLSLLKRYDVSRVRLVCHPLIYGSRIRRGADIGAPFTREQLLAAFADVRETREPLRISEHGWFLGDIPRVTTFEESYALGQRMVDGRWQDDFIPDDSALAFVGEQGTLVVAGCSHSGVCNTILRAEQVTGQPVRGVIGGFHLRSDGERAQATAEFMREHGVRELYPAHCTCFHARVRLANDPGCYEVTVGTQLSWD